MRKEFMEMVRVEYFLGKGHDVGHWRGRRVQWLHEEKEDFKRVIHKLDKTF